MKYSPKVLAVLFFLFTACNDSSYPFKEFSHSDSYKTESNFKNDSSRCWAERNKHSHKIEGRKFGFKGKDTGFLGCMRLKGWNRIAVPKR